MRMPKVTVQTDSEWSGSGKIKNYGILNSKFGIRGFTILEVIIVIVILGMLTASVGYKLFSTSQTSSLVGVDQVVADIQYVQTLAMATMAPRSITFTSGSNTYDMVGESRKLPGDAVAGNTVTFTFDSLGEPTAGAGSAVVIGNRQVKVWEITGSVEEM